MESLRRRGRPKGLPRTGGRKPGSANKVSKDLRDTISAFLQNNASKMQVEYEKLDAKDKLAFFEKLIKYSLPAMTAVDHTTKGEPISPFHKSLEKMTDEELQAKVDDLRKRME